MGKFSWKWALTCHTNCLIRRRQFAWNIKVDFLGKNEKHISICRLQNFYPACIELIVIPSHILTTFVVKGLLWTQLTFSHLIWDISTVFASNFDRESGACYAVRMLDISRESVSVKRSMGKQCRARSDTALCTLPLSHPYFRYINNR